MPDRLRPPGGHRVRVVSDNDYAGDPDGLFQLAHHALSPSVDLRGVLSSHLAPGDPFDASGRSAANGVVLAREVLDLVGRDVPVLAGAEEGLRAGEEPSPAARLIVEEARRTDTDLPLFVTLGGGLTELAAALLLDPGVADRLTAVWIGGPEHAALGAVPPPGAMPVEYNLNIDRRAAQVVFDSDVRLWQVPRNAYREALVSTAELATRVRTRGRVGRHLHESIDAVAAIAARSGHDLGETYVLGDNPLVLLTALQSSFEPDPSSSRYALVPRPRIDDHGAYVANPAGAPVRVYSGLDVRLMLGDFFAKLELATADEADRPRSS